MAKDLENWKEKAKQSNAEWRKNNSEKVKQRNAEWRKNKEAKKRKNEEHSLPFKKRKYVVEAIQYNTISSTIISTSPKTSDISYDTSYSTNNSLRRVHEPETAPSAFQQVDSMSSNISRPSVICWASNLSVESYNNNLLQPDSCQESWSQVETNIVDNSYSETNKETHLNFSKQQE